ncbi:MAG: hypothetical protein Tsb0010_05710 [Parvularculaceae bacterium]
MGAVSTVFTAAAILAASAAIYRFLSPRDRAVRGDGASRPAAAPKEGVELIEDPKTGVYRPK